MKILENLRKVTTQLKHQRRAKIYCPKCASPQIHLFSNSDHWLNTGKYICDNCGYSGPILLELEKEKDD